MSQIATMRYFHPLSRKALEANFETRNNDYKAFSSSAGGYFETRNTNYEI